MNCFKKTIISLFILTMLILITGCSDKGNSDFINGLKPSQGQYRIHLYYGKVGNHQYEMVDLNKYVNSDERITGFIPQVQAHETTKELEKKLKTIGVDTLPSYVLVDSEGVKLITPYLSEVKEFINNQILKQDEMQKKYE